MTERLSALLHAEATDLDVPAPEAPTVLTRGRSLRRRRRVVSGLAATAVVVVIGAGVATALGVVGDDRAEDPLPAGGFRSTGAFSVGQDLYVGGREVSWDEPIKALYYTSAGVVVRSGDDDYTLVTPDGARSSVDIDAPDRVLGFEPDSTHVAYAEPNGGAWDIVVRDVVTDEEIGRQTLSGRFTWGGWQAPPVAIDGDWVWVHFDGAWTEVAWADGAIRMDATTETTYELANGHYADWDSRTDVWTIRRMSNHTKVADIQLEKGWYAFFSPDGNYLRAFPNDVETQPVVDTIVYDARTGEKREITDPGDSLGWTPDGNLLEVDGDTFRICPVLSGTCASYDFDRGKGAVTVGGDPSES